MLDRHLRPVVEDAGKSTLAAELVREGSWLPSVMSFPFE